MKTAITSSACLDIPDHFRITRALEADLAAHEDEPKAEAEAIFACYDRIATLIAGGRTEAARAIAAVLSEDPGRPA